MSTKVLISMCFLGGALAIPGTLLDADGQVAALAAGGELADPTDPYIAAALVLCNHARAHGQDENFCGNLMRAGQSMSNRAALPTLRTVTIGFAAFAALAAGVKTYDVNLGAVLPTGAVLLAPPQLSGFTGFDDAAHGTYAAIVGTTTGGNDIATTQSVAAGQTNFPKVMTAGTAGFPMSALGAAQAKVRITSSVDLNTATAGAVTVSFRYAVFPPA